LKLVKRREVLNRVERYDLASSFDGVRFFEREAITRQSHLNFMNHPLWPTLGKNFAQLKIKPKSVLTLIAFLVGTSLSASATINITDSFDGNLGTMPGSPTDYTFFGNGSEFPGLPFYGAAYGGTNPPQPTVLTDFVVSAGSDAGGQYAGTSGYSTINGPVGSSESSVETGDIFAPGSSGGDEANIVDFTLGTPGSTFDFSNFNVYVMFGSGPGDANDHITNIDLAVVSSASTVSDAPVLVSDTNTNTGVASFEEFHITGASAGDVIEIGTGTTAPFSSYLGGVSFEEAIPEPSIWTMMLGGVALLGFWVRRKGAKFQV
jgi:hypothetical protein